MINILRQDASPLDKRLQRGQGGTNLHFIKPFPRGLVQFDSQERTAAAEKQN
jgi:hypothetical protein